MIRIQNEQELRECFRPLDRGEVELPQGLEFPFIVRDYFSWTEPSGFRVFLVMTDRTNRQGLGIVFRRDQSSNDMARMCDWCHSVSGGNSITLLTAASSERKRVGIHLCRDLGCKQKVEALVDDGILTPYQRMRRITDRMVEFARKTCF